MIIDPVRSRTVGAAFLENAAAQPDRTAVTIYRGSGETEHLSLTYAELARRAGLRADDLVARAAPGERVLICLPTGTEFVELYLACLLAGLVAVPLPAPGSSGAAAQRVGAVAADCRPAFAFTTAADQEDVRELLRSRGLGHVPVEEPGDVGPGGTPTAHRDVTADTLAVLQYSSGSTGSPKGAMLNHSNILANLRAIRAGGGFGEPDDSIGSWLPMHHDFGLFGHLTHALVHGASTVLMPPLAFARKPVEWFRLMHQFRTTVTGAPDFAFALCLRLIRDDQLDGIDLSALRSFWNGAEPIHVPTLTAFTKRFARVGLQPAVFSPVYGMAETTAFLSCRERTLPPTILVADRQEAESADHPRLVRTTGAGSELAGVGFPRDHEMRIVDTETRRSLPPGSIGEIWLRGASVGQGYWNQPETTAEAFRARLTDEPEGAPGWLRSGDLGAVVDGELFITGRLKEMVIVRGRKLFPSDLEQQARLADPALHGLVGAAFGVAVPEERVVLIHEVGPRVKADDLPQIAMDVMRHLTATFGVPIRNVLLVRRGAVGRTTSGKIQRQGMREQFLAGRVAASFSALDPDVRRLLAGDPQ